MLQRSSISKGGKNNSEVGMITIYKIVCILYNKTPKPSSMYLPILNGHPMGKSRTAQPYIFQSRQEIY